jgi:predicted phage-related endonuclease
MSDFDPEVRNAAWWSGDSRMAASGKAGIAVLQKLGMVEPDDLSGVEAVQMGHVMQPIIGRLAQERLGIELKDADYAMTHPTEPWMRSHFDFISADGQTLVEAKNYTAAVRNKFDAGALIIPAPDLAQLVHEAACHSVSRIVLAVLFGGQNFETFDFQISGEQKTHLIQEMAKYWAAVCTKTPLEPTTTVEAKALYPISAPTSKTAPESIEQAVATLKQVKEQIKQLEEREEQLQASVQAFMGPASELVTFDGQILATWKSSKGSKKFDAKLFQAMMPDTYEKFTLEASGSRRFLTK